MLPLLFLLPQTVRTVLSRREMVKVLNQLYKTPANLAQIMESYGNTNKGVLSYTAK
jgi:hypothetical protein